MKFNVEKLKQISRPMTDNERKELESRNNNRDWLALSAKFALLVRHILRTEKITQTELAARMGVSCGQITKILSGKENLGLQTIAKVEKALGRSLITFSDQNETAVFTSSQQTFTQVFYLPISSSYNENRALKSQSQDCFSLLSNDKILV